MDTIDNKLTRGLIAWRWVTVALTLIWPISYALQVPESSGRSGYYLGEALFYGFIAGLVGYKFFKAGRDRSLWIQFILICVNVFVIYKLSIDRTAIQSVATTSSEIGETLDYANGARGSLPLAVAVGGEEADPQTPEQLVRNFKEVVARAAPALRANRDEMAQIDLGSVLSSNTLCNSSRRAQARSALATYERLSLRRIELAMGIQQAVKHQVYSYDGAGRDEVIRGFEKSNGPSVNLVNSQKEVELSIAASASDVLTLADEKDSSIRCKGNLVYWPDQTSLAQYNKSMGEVRAAAAREKKINSEIASHRTNLDSMAHGQLPQ